MYSLGWLFSVIGQQVQSVAVQWQVFQRMPSASGGALALGLVGGVQALPVILLALPAGHLADRFDRRKIVMLSMLFSGLFSIGLAGPSAWTAGSPRKRGRCGRPECGPKSNTPEIGRQPQRVPGPGDAPGSQTLRTVISAA